MFFVMQIRVIFALPSLVPPFLGALGSCPSRLPLDPPLPAATGAATCRHSTAACVASLLFCFIHCLRRGSNVLCNQHCLCLWYRDNSQFLTDFVLYGLRFKI